MLIQNFNEHKKTEHTAKEAQGKIPHRMH